MRTADVGDRRLAVKALVASLTAAFVLSQFYRSSVAVIAPELMVDLALHPSDLGFVTGAFFAAIAIFQIPVGILLDAYGPRRVTPTLLSLAVAGSAVFSQADGLAGLVLGQALIGAGCAGVFMGGLVAVSRWFPADRFSTAAAAMLAVSNGGLLLSATPFAALTQAVGWRTAFLGISGLTIVLGSLILLFVRDAPPGHDYFDRRRESLREAVAGMGEVLRNRDLVYLLAISFVAYAAMFSIRGLWGGPYLADIYGLDPVSRGNVLFVMSIGTIVGLSFYGPLDRFIGARKKVVLTGAGGTIAILAVLALVPRLPLFWVGALFTVLGLVGAYAFLLIAHGRALFPDRLVGRAITTVNFANFLGVGVIQAATGFIVDGFEPIAGHPPEIAYRTVFGVIAAILLTAALIYTRVAEPHRK